MNVFLAAILLLLFMPKQWCLQLVIRQKWIQHLKIIETTQSTFPQKCLLHLIHGYLSLLGLNYYDQCSDQGTFTQTTDYNQACVI